MLTNRYSTNLSTPNAILERLDELPPVAESAYVEAIMWQGTITVDATYEPELFARLSDEDGDDYVGRPNMNDTIEYLTFTADQFPIADEAVPFLHRDLQSFWESLPATVRLKLVAFTPQWDATQFAHDYALTRHHHGAGYWDRSAEAYGGLNDYLTESSQTMGEVELYLNTDNEVEVSI